MICPACNYNTLHTVKEKNQLVQKCSNPSCPDNYKSVAINFETATSQLVDVFKECTEGDISVDTETKILSCLMSNLDLKGF